MANIAVVIELSEGRPLLGCLEVLGQARRISSALGATLYAAVPLLQDPDGTTPGQDELIVALQTGGADKVLLLHVEISGHPPEQTGWLWGSHGAAVAQISELLSPTLLLFSTTAGAREVAARAAAHIGAAFLSDASIECRGGEPHEGQLALWEGAGTNARRLGEEIDFPVVATIRRGRYQPAAGDDEAEVEIVRVPTPALGFEEVGWESDPTAVVVHCPQGGAAITEACAQLAEALGGVTKRSTANDPITVSFDRQLEIALGDAVASYSSADLVLIGSPEELAVRWIAALKELR